MERATNFSFDCGQLAQKHHKIFASLLFRFILHVCNRRPTCLPPQRDIHTMSRGTTLFSCGSVGEFMPFVFFVFFFSSAFAIFKRNVAVAQTISALRTMQSILGVYINFFSFFIFILHRTDCPFNGLISGSSRPRRGLSPTAPPPLPSPLHPNRFSLLPFSPSVTHPPLTMRAHLPPHNVAHRSRGSQLQPNPPVACVNNFFSGLSHGAALIALCAKDALVPAQTRPISHCPTFLFLRGGTSRGGVPFTVSTVNVDTDIVLRVSCWFSQHNRLSRGSL